MGFYGNITQNTRFNFQFVRTYPNRAMMDDSAASDGVFLGNYVLVSYDTNLAGDWAQPNCHIYKENGVYEVWDNEKTVNGAHRYTYSDLQISPDIYPANSQTNQDGRQAFRYLMVPGEHYVTQGGQQVLKVFNHAETQENDTIWRVAGSFGSSPVWPRIERLVEDNSTYGQNQAIDVRRYQNSRGYDSTVWQKVYSGTPAVPHYALIAELNTIVPTFSVTTDAPTVSPLAPHFDITSTNFNYKLHLQPSWGFRIKSAVNVQALPNLTTPYQNVSTGNYTNLNFNQLVNKLPSDQTVVWSRPFYDESGNQVISYTYEWKDQYNHNTGIRGRWALNPGSQAGYTTQIPGAIYFNKAGFNYTTTSHITTVQDEITVTPSGLSGVPYYVHDVSYSPLNSITNTATFRSTLEYLQREYPNDTLGRNQIYKVSDSHYVVANGYQENTLFYQKITDFALNTTTPQVDTQELSIMLPSIGNIMSDIWDLIYGGVAVNGSTKRNTNFGWRTNGGSYYSGTGLRLIHTSNSALSYSVKEANTVIGALNTAHDIIGMIIAPTPLNKKAALYTESDIKNYCDKSNIYYSALDKKYYRVGVKYVWDTTDYNAYNPSDELNEPFIIPIEHYIEWPEPNNIYFTRSPVSAEYGQKYNYLLSQELQTQVQYYTLSHVPSNVKQVGATFIPNMYYGYNESYRIVWTDKQNTQQTTYTKAWALHTDVEPVDTHRYFTVEITNTLDSNIRIFTTSATDITKQFFKVPDNGGWKVATEFVTENGIQNEIPLRREGYVLNPNRYYIQHTDATTGKIYYRHTNEFDSTKTYYEPIQFILVNEYDPTIDDYYVLAGRAQSGTTMLVSRTTYIAYEPGVIDSQNAINQRSPYYFDNTDGRYKLATEYDPSIQYFYQQVSWQLEEISAGISAATATQVQVINGQEQIADPYNTTGTHYRNRYWYHNPVGQTNAAEFYAINNDLLNADLGYAIVELDIHEYADFYVQGTLWYHDMEPGYYQGSWLLDEQPEMTEGRVYYTDAPVGVLVTETIIKDRTPQGLVDVGYNEVPYNWNTATLTLYKKCPLYVYQDNNPSPMFSQGERWNMHARLDVGDNIILRQLKETLALIEIPYLGRAQNTMLGLINYTHDLFALTDQFTRATNSVQGLLHNISDLLNTYQTIIPNGILTTNKHGKIIANEPISYFGSTIASKLGFTISEGYIITGASWNASQQKMNYSTYAAPTSLLNLTTVDENKVPTAKAVKDYIDYKISLL